jgi:hypothetical protein
MPASPHMGLADGPLVRKAFAAAAEAPQNLSVIYSHVLTEELEIGLLSSFPDVPEHSPVWSTRLRRDRGREETSEFAPDFCYGTHSEGSPSMPIPFED